MRERQNGVAVNHLLRLRRFESYCTHSQDGEEVSRMAHNHQTVGSNPTPAMS
jgi:hypothetical protein